mmetsp:Transcript_4209/g.11858  ORF Transcript_4209/g.11858 Transcript_4209/m.11858 type:complete len:214 (+) Transcript_4209:453-1094(+)
MQILQFLLQSPERSTNRLACLSATDLQNATPGQSQTGFSLPSSGTCVSTPLIRCANRSRVPVASWAACVWHVDSCNRHHGSLQAMPWPGHGMVLWSHFVEAGTGPAEPDSHARSAVLVLIWLQDTNLRDRVLKSLLKSTRKRGPSGFAVFPAPGQRVTSPPPFHSPPPPGYPWFLPWNPFPQPSTLGVVPGRCFQTLEHHHPTASFNPFSLRH